MAAVEGSASALSVPNLSLDFDGTISGNVLKGQVSTPVKANLKDGVWELAKIAANLTLGRTDTALKAQLSGAATVNPAKQMVAVTGLDATATGTYDQLKGLDLHVSGNLAADARKHEYTADKVALQAKGTFDKDAFTAAFQAPKLRVTPSKAEGQAVTGAVTLKGPQHDIDAKLNIAAVEGSASALSIPSLSLDLVSMVSGNGVKGNISTPVRANLSARTWDLPKVVANLTFSGPAIPQKTVTLPITGSLRADLAKQTASAGSRPSSTRRASTPSSAQRNSNRSWRHSTSTSTSSTSIAICRRRARTRNPTPRSTSAHCGARP
jgi:AsmA protein